MAQQQQITLNTSTMQEVGDNILAEKQGTLLVLVIDTSKEIGPSTSGR